MIRHLEIEKAPRELRDKYNAADAEMNILIDQKADNKQIFEAQDTRDEYLKTMIQIYKDSLKNDPLRVVKDIKEVLKDIVKSDFVFWLPLIQKYAKHKDETPPEASVDTPQQFPGYDDIKEDYRSAIIYLQDILYLQICILLENDKPLDEAQSLIRDKAAEWYEPEEIEEATLARIAINKFIPVKDVDYPIDRPNNEIWRTLEAIKTDGQLTIGRTILTGKGKKNKEVSVIMSISWDQPGTKLTTTLNSIDKRIYTLCGALHKAGNEVFTINQINKLLTGSEDASDLQKSRINDSLTKMGKGKLFYSNKGEVENNYKYPEAEYDGPLLAFERVKITVKGKETTAIHLLCEPRLITFSRERKQITTYKKEYLKLPISVTDENLTIQDCLLTNISATKERGASFLEIKFLTIKERCKIGSKHFNRVPGKIKAILDYLEEQRFIINSIILKDRVKIGITEQVKLESKAESLLDL